MNLQLKSTETSREENREFSLPTEILVTNIFPLVPGRQLFRCRQVCRRWKQIIDGFLTNDNMLWREHCKRDFCSIYQTARLKSKPGVLWFEIYRSLALWSKLACAKESLEELPVVSKFYEEIMNLKVIEDGIIGIQKRGAIAYYDLATSKPCEHRTLTGDYLHYAENEHIVVIVSFYYHLFIIRKVLQNPEYKINVTIDNVKSFLLVDEVLYYVTLENVISLCALKDGNFASAFITQCFDGVMCLGYSENRLNVLTYTRQIYTVINGDLVFACSLSANKNLLHELHKYNFLERVEWRVYYQWMCMHNHSIPQGPLRDIVVVRTYGDVVFVGSNWGVLLIYYAPYNADEFDLFSAIPVKRYKFMERTNSPILSMCPVIEVDVIEEEEGHKVIVAMPKKIMILSFVHKFKNL